MAEDRRLHKRLHLAELMIAAEAMTVQLMKSTQLQHTASHCVRRRPPINLVLWQQSSGNSPLAMSHK